MHKQAVLFAALGSEPRPTVGGGGAWGGIMMFYHVLVKPQLLRQDLQLRGTANLLNSAQTSLLCMHTGIHAPARTHTHTRTTPYGTINLLNLRQTPTQMNAHAHMSTCTAFDFTLCECTEGYFSS